MDRVQRSGVITLVLLLVVAAAGLILGPNRPGDQDAPPAAAVLDSDLAASLPPPQARRYFVTPDSFRLPPVSHPAGGRGERDINQPVDLDAMTETGLEIDFREGSGSPGQQTAAGTTRARGEGFVRVREGDSLIKIARRELGSADYADELAAFNGITDPRSLRIGQVLGLPRIVGAVKPPAPEEAALAGRASAEPEPAVAVVAARTYRVRSGDTPSEIAQRLYGTSKVWRKLLAANGIKDPKDLRAGQELQVPPLD